MQINIPGDVLEIICRLEDKGFEAHVVGGCVRDTLLGDTPEDWDVTTSALPEDVKSIFDHTADTGIKHGTVTVVSQNTTCEVTTYRLDGEYRDGRHPEEVSFTRSLEEDLKRRDFTINAMAYSPKRGLTDLFGGRADLEKKVIRAVGDPEKRFGEDALRMMRAVRFSARLGFDIEDDTKDAIAKLSSNLGLVSNERIREELMKLLTSPNPGKLRDLYGLGLTGVFLPEFDVMMETPQNTPHHIYTVGEHTVRAVENIRPDPILRLTMLLHDVSKPKCRTTDASGRDHFKGHPVEGEKDSKNILRRLKFDNHTIKKVSRLVRFHDANPKAKKTSVRRLVAEAGRECYPWLFEIKKADISAQSMYHRKEKLSLLEVYEKYYHEIINDKDPLETGDLAISGRDLKQMGIKEGKMIGMILNDLLEMAIEDPSVNDGKKLRQIVKEEYL